MLSEVLSPESRLWADKRGRTKVARRRKTRRLAETGEKDGAASSSRIPRRSTPSSRFVAIAAPELVCAPVVVESQLERGTILRSLRGFDLQVADTALPLRAGHVSCR
jgi:hypothetical protein